MRDSEFPPKQGIRRIVNHSYNHLYEDSIKFSFKFTLKLCYDNLFESSDDEEDKVDSLCNNNACSSGKSGAGYSSLARYERSSFLHGTLNNSSRSLNKSINNIQTKVIHSSSTPIAITSSKKSNTSMVSTEEEKEKGGLYSLLLKTFPGPNYPRSEDGVV